MDDPTHHPATVAVHAGREDLRQLGVHAPPIDLSSTYPLSDLDADGEAFDRWAEGAEAASNPIYARLHNPTVARCERAIAALEHADGAVAFASGMAATCACVTIACRERRHVVGVRPLYGGTDLLLDSGLLGTEVTWTDAHGIAAALRPDTGLVVVETPQNPTLGLVDIEQVVRAAEDVPVLIDNTFATPILQNPLDAGAAYALHSATKFLSGHGDVLAGVVATDHARAAELRQHRVLTGGALHPLAAYLLHRGLPTLPLRVERAQRTAGLLATRLAEHPRVSTVHYPGLNGEPLPPQLRGPGALLAFELEDPARGDALIGALRLITPAVSLGNVDTLIQWPARFTHRKLTPEARAAAGIPEGLLRMSVGLEDPDDLWADLAQALECSPADEAIRRPRAACAAASSAP